MRAFTWAMWLAIGGLLGWFAVANWTPISVAFPPFVMVETRLPLLVFVLLFLVALGGGIAFKMARWSWKRQLRKAERVIAGLQEKLDERERAASPAAQETALMERARAAGYGDGPPPSGHSMAAPPLA